MSIVNENLVSVKEMDFLDQDPPLRGQNFVCLSFISPEDVIKRKDCYFFEEFMKDITVDMNDFFDKLMEKYEEDAGTLKTIKERYSYLFNKDHIVDEYNFFINKKGSLLEDDYFKQNNFQTSIRGLKVRGVFDTLREAEIRSQVLKKLDDKFNVYVAQVGCWCPWSPNPEEIDQQEYAETQLNTMMKHYKENQDKKDLFYQERKRDLQFSKTKTKIEEDDAWLTNKEASTSGFQDSSTTTDSTATPSDSSATASPSDPSATPSDSSATPSSDSSATASPSDSSATPSDSSAPPSDPSATATPSDSSATATTTDSTETATTTDP